MKKNNYRERNKNKKVHFNEDQLNERTKNLRPKSAGKNYDDKANNIHITSNSHKISSRLSTRSTQKKTSIEDFTIIQELGSGSYAKVFWQSII